jgi:sugar phosphate permease
VSASVVSPGPFTRARRVTVPIAIAAQGFHSLAFGCVGLFLPLIRSDLGMSYTQAGFLSAASILVFASMQIPVGYLADRASPKRLLVIGLLGTMALAITLGLVQNFWQALANQAVSGFFRAFLFIPGLALVTGWFPPARRATVMGMYTAGGFAGLVLLDLIGPVIVREFTWRALFVAFPLFGVALALLLARLGRDFPRTPGQRRVTLLETLGLFKHRVIQVSCGLQYVRLAIVSGLGFWMSSLLVDERGIAITSVGLIIALRDFTTAVSNPLGGYVSDKLRNPPLVIGFSLVMLGITTMLLIVVHSIPLLILVIAVNAMFVQFYFGSLFLVPMEVLGARTAGSSAGFTNLFANLGSFTFSLLLGALRDATGSFAVGFALVAGLAAVGLLLTLWLARIRKKALSAFSLQSGTA